MNHRAETPAFQGGEDVRIYLQRAVQRGVAIFGAMPCPDQPQHPPLASADTPCPTEVPSPPLSPPPSSRLRRIGRRSLQLLRPAFAPFLHRLESRIRTAVDTSVKLSRMETELGVMQNNLIEVLHRTASFANSLATIRQALDRMAETEDLLLQKGDLLLQKEDLLLQRRVVPLGSELLIRTLDGWILIPKEDVGLVMGMAESAGLLEPGTRKVVTELLTLGGVMIDVGAHVGCLTLAAVRKVGDSGHVIAFEPTPRTVGLLRANIRLNGLSDRTTIHACAAGARYEFAMLNLSPHHSHNSLLPLAEATDVVEVEVQPIDAVVAAGRRVDLVKIDAEGAELSVWQGMQRVINDNPQLAVIVELGPSHLARANISLTEWLAELSRPGFTAWEIDETSGSLQPLRPISDLEKVHSVNLLLLRDHPLDRVGLRLA